MRPRRGDALVWYGQTPSGELDGRTRHGGCPVAAGRQKDAANVWVWNDQVIYASGGALRP